MSERKLAHIEKVVDIQPIQGADKIEVATVLGWKCVVKKGEVKVGDHVCYIEVDSVVPNIPFFEFLQERKFRVRTIKLRKQVSQGLIITMDNLWEIVYSLSGKKLSSVHEGDDVTNLLNITKYESASDKESNLTSSKEKLSVLQKWLTQFKWYNNLIGVRSKGFPDWISKTDEERIQNIPSILKDSKQQFYYTEKLDGQSATYWYKHHWLNPEFGVCSRNIRKNYNDNSNWSKVAKLFRIKEKLKVYHDLTGDEIAIQGEIIGPTIQGNKYKLEDFKFYVFNVYNIKTKTFFDNYSMRSFCVFNDWSMVPTIKEVTTNPLTVDEMVELSKGKSVLCAVEREGIVVRSTDQTISFKVINPDFLLKNEE